MIQLDKNEYGNERRVPTDARWKIRRLMQLAKEEEFARDLLLNGYNRHLCKVDMRQLMSYADEKSYTDDNEHPDYGLINEIMYFLCLVARGVDTHEVTGQAYINELADLYEQQYGTPCYPPLS